MEDIYCYECDPPKKFKQITERHLKLIHAMTIEEYKRKHPNKKLYSKRTKVVKCSNSTDDAHDAIVDINIPTSLAICDDCRNKGLKIKNCNENIIKKRKETSLKNTGYDNPSKNPLIKEKKKNTYLKNTNGEFDNPMKNPEIQNKSKETCNEKYGKSNPMKVEQFVEKQRNTLKENYGVDYPLKNNNILNKMLNTSYKRYNGIGYSSKIIKEKIDNTVQLRYGVDNVSKSIEVKNKRERTFIKDWGATNSSSTDEGKHRIKRGALKRFIPRLKRMLKFMKLEIINMNEYDNCYQMLEFICKECNNEFKQKWNYVQTYYTCPICYPRTRGRGAKEIELFNFINSLNFNSVIPNDRKTIIPYEIDILINDVNIGIEFNELLGHSEAGGKFVEYHLNKTIMAKDSNIRLIHIFEDEWLYKKDIVIHLLKNILNKSDADSIHARKCIIKDISPSIKNNFLDEFHLQGKDSSLIKLGAFYNNELISVMTFSHGSISKGGLNNDKSVFELNRFCTNYNYKIPGIASKLLTHFKRNYKWSQIYSFCDRRWSVGNLYYKLGFDLIKINPPSYHYVKQIKDPETNQVDLKRLHRFTLRKTKEEQKFNLTEVELRFQQGYYRIWDCGNLKFVLNNK